VPFDDFPLEVFLVAHGTILSVATFPQVYENTHYLDVAYQDNAIGTSAMLLDYVDGIRHRPLSYQIVRQLNKIVAQLLLHPPLSVT